MVEFSKYKFINKLLDIVTLLRVISGVTWIQPLYIYIYNHLARDLKLQKWINFYRGTIKTITSH